MVAWGATRMVPAVLACAVAAVNVAVGQQHVVTSIETTASGSGSGSAVDWITLFPTNPLAEYSDSLEVTTPTNSGPRTLGGAISISAGTTFAVTVTYTNPEPKNPPFIFAYATINFNVTANTTVHIDCSGPAGPEWVLSGDATADIDAPYDGDLALSAGAYTLDTALDWHSSTPHTLSITAADADTLRLDDHDMYVEVFTSMTSDISDSISNEAGIPFGSEVQVETTLPDCSGEYPLEAAISYLDDVGSPLGNAGFVASGTAGYADCATGAATFRADFTLADRHYAIWAALYDYPNDAPFLGSAPLCSAFGGFGCMELAPGGWHFTDGGIFDGSDVLVSVELVPATIRVPEDAATISAAITLAGERASAILALEPFCNVPDALTFTVSIDPGIYAESITAVGPGVDLTITASNGPGTVEITGDSLARCLALETGYTSVLVDGITFRDGSADFGGAVLVDGATDVEFLQCTFSNNSATADGGAVTVQGSTDATFTSCNFNLNTAGLSGGAIALLPSGANTTTIDTCTVESNTATVDGGGLYHLEAVGSSVEVVNSVICWNLPGNIGGPWTDLGGNTICLDCLGDLVSDGIVNGADLTLLLGTWGACPAKGTCLADLNDDGLVNGADLTVLLGAWGPCP